MKTAIYGLVLSGLAALSAATSCHHKPLVNDRKLQKSIKIEALLKRSQKLQDFAYAYPERNRVAGGNGHKDTVKYIVKELEATGAYDVYLEPFSVVIQVSGTYALAIDAVTWQPGEFQFSGSGNVSRPLIPVANLGCTAEDYPAAVRGNVALISRGTCDFGLKSSLAGAAGAVGAILYDNVAGTAPLSGTLGSTPRPTGPYVPTVGITRANGTALVATINGGKEVIATLNVKTDIQNITTDNVIATTKCGDKNNVLFFGAHTDSVPPGPGINDDGSGTVGLIEVAKQLSRYKTNNAIRFGFWSAEEVGLVGSTYHVNQLSNSSRAQIKAYLNFDMIASPNYFHGIYDGDGSSFNLTGPRGSAELEYFLEEFFTPYNFTGTAFSGRSDYKAFIDNGIPAGGTFTGAEQIKTAAEAELFGGQAGVAYDVNYHKVGDTIDNLNKESFIIHTKAIAHAAAVYGTSWEGFPSREAPSVTKFKRELRDRHNEMDVKDALWHVHQKREEGTGHTHAGCGPRKLLSTMLS